MKTRTGFSLITGIALAVLAGLAFTPGARAADDSANTVVLRAIGAPSGVPVAVLDVNQSPNFVMMDSQVEGDRGAFLLVTDIDAANSRVTIQDQHQTQVLVLARPRAVQFPRFDPEQITAILDGYKRDAVTRLPGEWVANWRHMNYEDKERALLECLNRGLVVSISSGGGSAVIAKLFERQMVARDKERRMAFLDSLDAAQRRRFMGTPMPVLSLKRPPSELKAQAEAARPVVAQQKADRAAVLAELTPAQRELYERWQGPAKP